MELAEIEIAEERFVSPPDGEAPAVALSAAETAAAPDALVLHLDGARHRVPCRAGQSVLEAAPAAGLDPPSACTEGYGGSCAGRVRAGEVKMAANDVLREREVAAGHVRTCPARALGPGCEIRWDE